MALKIGIVSGDLDNINEIDFDGNVIKKNLDKDSTKHTDVDQRPTLGHSDRKTSTAIKAIKIDEIFTAISNSLKGKIDKESELIIELTGSVKVEGKAGADFLFFNVEGSANKNNSMKISFKTTIVPKED